MKHEEFWKDSKVHDVMYTTSSCYRHLRLLYTALGTIHNDINSKHQPFIPSTLSDFLSEGKSFPVLHEMPGPYSLSGNRDIGGSHIPNLDINWR
jgi:hypothetical protein